MLKRLKRLYFKMFKRYRRLEMKFVPYSEGDAMIRANDGKPETERWVIADDEERRSGLIGMVYLERRERITG